MLQTSDCIYGDEEYSLLIGIDEHREKGSTEREWKNKNHAD